MTNTKSTSLITFALLAIMQLTGCAKTVQWEEEVLLNTGETIWVTKEVRYTIRGQSGNPADLGYRPDFKESTSFKYSDRSYSYTGDASIMVLAISPQRLPVLLAIASSASDWAYKNRYECVTPYYVQLMPDSTGLQWTWPDKIEPWTYNLPANLMRNRDHPSEVKRRYTVGDKVKQTYMQDPSLSAVQKIDPLFTGIRCKGNN